MTSFITTLSYEDWEYEVEYEVEPYVPARVSGPPEDCYPAEGGYATVLKYWSITDDEDMPAPTQVPDETLQTWEREIETFHDWDDDGGYADYEYERRRDRRMEDY